MMKKTAFFILPVFMGLCGICAGRVADGWKITQITNRDFINPDDCPIAMSEKYLVWVETHPDGEHLFVLDRGSGSIVQISSEDADQPGLSGGNLVWEQNGQIMFWNGSGPVQISSGTGFCTNPKISGNNVVWVWVETVDYPNAQIFFWNGGTPIQISSGSGILKYHSGLSISGGNVVWVQNGQIMFWNGGSPMAISTGDWPKISGSRVVWLESGLLMCWDGVSAAPIPESENAYLYDISESLVVWCNEWYVKAWDGSETRTLWKGCKYRDRPPAVSGSQLVWEEWADSLRSSYVSLYYSDSYNGVFLTDMPGGTWPVISGTDVAFLALDEDYKWQIFLAQPETAAPFQLLSADINKDNIVDLADLSILASQWLGVSKERILYFPLNTNPGWTCQGQWAFGRPLGGGGTQHGFPDPVKGNTGSNVYGVNLSGDYSVAVGGPYYLTAGPFDCSAYEETELQFVRWLNSDEAGYVRCTVEVSTNGTDWFVIWTNAEGQEHTENQWQTVAYDISSIADGQSAVLIRWGYQIRDKRAWPYSGWNIDDIALYGQKSP